jgi:predicted MPP superfamily phosphohydrolase
MRSPSRILFFLLVLTILLGICATVVYQAVALAFGITNTHALVILGFVIGLFTVSFIVAVFVTNRFYNLFTRIWYTASAVWIGFFVYAFFMSIVYGLLITLYPPLIPIGQFLFLLAIAVTAYGVIHAKHISVTEIRVTLPNLPAAWRNRKAVWISDVHLGQVSGPAFAREVSVRVMELSPDIIFVGGDLYDGDGAGDIPELTAPLTSLTAPLGVYFVTGNHEEYGHRDDFVAAVVGAGMRVLDDEMTEVEGVQLLGVDYQRASDAARFKEILAKLSIDRNKPSILLKHEPKDLDVAEAAGVSLQISGHTHRAQMWPLEYIAQRAYRGFAYGLRSLKKMQVYTSSGVGTWGPPLRVGTKSEIVLIRFI